MASRFATLFSLTKPGIVFGNLVSVTGGYLLGSPDGIQWGQGFLVAAGVSMVVASGCVANNVADRDIDALMARTRGRALVDGRIAPAAALAWSALLGLGGLGLLYLATGRWLPLLLVLTGFGVYVGGYTLWLKRRSVHGTLIGSLSGAMPPVVGYCAAAGRFDLAALLLLITFALWQMPHSYAIAIFRGPDYQAARIPVLPLVRGLAAARRQMVAYAVAFTLSALALGLAGYAGPFYLAVAAVSGVSWLRLCLRRPGAQGPVRWSRGVFGASILVVMALSAGMALDAQRPRACASLHGQ